MYVVRNVLICAIAVLAIIAIVFISRNRPVTDQTASIPPVEENPPYFNVSVNGELMQGASLVEMDFTEVHPITHPELFMNTNSAMPVDMRAASSRYMPERLP